MADLSHQSPAATLPATPAVSPTLDATGRKGGGVCGLAGQPLPDSGPWYPIAHPRASGFALINEEGRHRRHPIEGHVLCFSNELSARQAAAALAKVAA